MLVGDAKQAIYRWRGGKAEQFIDLSIDEEGLEYNPFYVEKKLENLATNFRSFSEVIEFNNGFFSYIADFLKNSTYKSLYEIGNKQGLNKNTGGYVQLDFLDFSELEKEEKEIAYPVKVLEIVQNLDPNFNKKDVCVIVRTKKDGIAVANYLTENEVPIISSETLLLQNSLKVQFVVNLLTYIQNPLNLNAKFKALNYIKDFVSIDSSDHFFYKELVELEPVEFFKSLERFELGFDYAAFLKMPFYESIEYLIRSFKLLSTTDAYVQFFLDFILDFQRKNHHDLSAFLVEWDQKREKLSIAVSEDLDAVRIMTIHKSKGLEFPVVFLTGMEDGVFPHQRALGSATELEEERRLAYVGITRAMQKLYLTFAESRSIYGTESFNSVSRFVRDIPKDVIEEVRLQNTISRPTSYAGSGSMHSDSGEETGFSLGQGVNHQVYGEGVILNFEGNGPRARVHVRFAEVGTKILILASANLMAL